MAFCTSLRRRASFASVIPALIAESRLQENRLDSHDISINLPTQAQSTGRKVRYLVLSQHATNATQIENTMRRVDRLQSFTGGQDVAIIFLMNLPEHTQDGQGLVEYSKLQIELYRARYGIPMLPLATLEALPSILQKHSSGLSRPIIRQRGTVVRSFDILQHCTINPPLNETMTYFITDLFSNLQELVLACSNVTSHDLNPLQTVDGPSPYFSSSAGSDLQLSTRGVDHTASKLRKLFKFDRKATLDIIRFWQHDFDET